MKVIITEANLKNLLINKLGIDYAIYSFLNGFGDTKERNAVRMIVENTYFAH